MINYFEAAEKTLRARGLLETALGNLERKKERILRYGAPSEYPSADMSKPYTGAKSVNDALADCLELAEVMREIQVTRDKVEEIDGVLAQMDEADARILRLWYIERKSKDEITEAVCYSSTSSLYDRRGRMLRLAYVHLRPAQQSSCALRSPLLRRGGYAVHVRRFLAYSHVLKKRCMETCIFPVLSLRRKERSRENLAAVRPTWSSPCAYA